MAERTAEESEGPPKTCLLLVEDEPDQLGPLSEILESHGYAVISTWDGEEALSIAAMLPPSLLVTDFRLGGIDGVTVIQKLRESHPQTRAILVSGHISDETRQRAAGERVHRIFQKPIPIPELLEALGAATR
jgi:CheY-like chemotaxis protein